MSDGPKLSLPLSAHNVTPDMLGQVAATAQKLVRTPNYGELITRINVHLHFFGGNKWDIPAELDFQVYLEIAGEQHWINRRFKGNGIALGLSCTTPNADPTRVTDWENEQKGCDLTKDSDYQLRELRAGLRSLIAFLADGIKEKAERRAKEIRTEVLVLQSQESVMRNLLI